MFDLIYTITNGGPGIATESVSTEIYDTAFVLFESGRASALGNLSVFVVIVLTRLYFQADAVCAGRLCRAMADDRIDRCGKAGGPPPRALAAALDRPYLFLSGHLDDSRCVQDARRTRSRRRRSCSSRRRSNTSGPRSTGCPPTASRSSTPGSDRNFANSLFISLDQRRRWRSRLADLAAYGFARLRVVGRDYLHVLHSRLAHGPADHRDRAFLFPVPGDRPRRQLCRNHTRSTRPSTCRSRSGC